MKKFVLSCGLAAVLAPGALVAEDLTGYVSDAHCGTAHSSVSDANTKCIDKCLKGGSDPVLVSNGKVMKFDTKSKEKAKTFAGDNVKIDGSVDGDTVTIISINKAE